VLQTPALPAHTILSGKRDTAVVSDLAKEPIVKFNVGLHQPSDVQHFERCMVSVNRLRTRKKYLPIREWMLDSGAFMELKLHGCYRHTPAEYAAHINRIKRYGTLVAAVAQDYMCEPFMLAKTGLTVADHQRLTIERYDALRPLTDVYIMPVLQGYQPHEYVSHIRQYGDRLTAGMWVGVGSVCKRNGNVNAIEDVLLAITTERPDLRLHGFGIKTTSTASSLVRSWLYSADSMAWSYAERRKPQGNANDWHAAARFCEQIATQTITQRGYQHSLLEAA
jgi:hypothetical protein